MEIVKIQFDEVIMEVEADISVCENLKFIYRNYITSSPNDISIYFRIDGSVEAILTNRDIIHIYYSYNGVDYKKWKYSDTIFPPLLVEPLKGRYLVLHGCCVAKNSSTVAILGKSMTGKTKIMLHLLKNGYKLISDDLIFVDKNNLVHAYKKPLGFRTLIANEYPELYDRILNLENKIAFRSYLNFTTYLVHADDLFDDIYDENLSKISKIVILSEEENDKMDIGILDNIYKLKGLCCNSGIDSQELVMRLISFINGIEIIKCAPEIVFKNISV